MGIEAIFGLDRNWQFKLTGPNLGTAFFTPGSLMARMYGSYLSHVMDIRSAALGTPAAPDEAKREEFLAASRKMLIYDLKFAAVMEGMKLGLFALVLVGTYSALK